MGYYRELHWWGCGWYSLYQWKHVLWQTDEYGDAVIIEKDTLRLFHNIDTEIT